MALLKDGAQMPLVSRAAALLLLLSTHFAPTAIALNTVPSRSITHSQRKIINDGTISRRVALSTTASALLGGIFVGSTQPAIADDNTRLQSRQGLLTAIQNANDAAVMNAIDELVTLDPSQGRAATLDSDLDGEWELIWSAKADAFSPLLKLPYPLKPKSYQYLGSAAASEVGPGRVAQGLTGGLLGSNQLWLSSGVVTSSTDPSMLIIQPPFRFQVGSRYPSGNKEKKMLAEAGSDAEFRQLNARTEEAQQAPMNQYKQLYLEREGKGSLRISTITDGDPVIVGAIFCHVKLS
jgi:hypothetical protein